MGGWEVWWFVGTFYTWEKIPFFLQDIFLQYWNTLKNYESLIYKTKLYNQIICSLEHFILYKKKKKNWEKYVWLVLV